MTNGKIEEIKTLKIYCFLIKRHNVPKTMPSTKSRVPSCFQELLNSVIIEKAKEEHVVQIVTNNATKYTVGGIFFMGRHPSAFYLMCFLLLGFNVGRICKIERIKGVVNKVKNIRKYNYNHTLLLSIMTNYTLDKKLALPTNPSFATNLNSLQCLITPSPTNHALCISIPT